MVKLDLARVEDAPLLGAMSRVWVEAGLGWRWTPAAIAREIRHADTEVLVARDGERVVGFAIMRFDEDHAHLFLLVIRPDYRRQGIGRSLLAWLERSARTAGVESIHLEVRAQNAAARTFYRALGYREVALIRGYYQGKEDAVHMHTVLRVKA